MIGNALKIAKIATGQIEDNVPEDDGKDKAAQAFGKRDERPMAEKLTPGQSASCDASHGHTCLNA